MKYTLYAGNSESNLPSGTNISAGSKITGDQSETEIVSGLCATSAIGRRLIDNKLATSRQPVGDHQKPSYKPFCRREVSLAATKTSLQPSTTGR